MVTDGWRWRPHWPGPAAPRTPQQVSTLDPKRLRPQTVGSVSGSERWRALLIAVPGTSQRVLLAVSMSRVDATLQRLHLAVLAAGASVLVVLAAAGFWVARLGLRPIVEVTEVADAIAAGDRSRRVRKTRPGTEAAHLARAFNLMLDEQQALEDRLRQFVADASHELRTPVSAIQGFAELWRQGHMREGLPLEDAMRRIGQESSRMARVVEDLLLLARLDEGHVLERGPVDLAPLVHDAVLDASATHPSRDVRAETDGPVIALGDEGALRQVVANLVTNALIHTPTNASVTVRATGSRRRGCSGGDRHRARYGSRKRGPRLRPFLAGRPEPIAARIRPGSAYRGGHRRRPRWTAQHGDGSR